MNTLSCDATAVRHHSRFDISVGSAVFLLSLVLIGSVAFLWSFHIDSFFGVFHDDTIYFSSAKAIAQTGSYIVPTFPGVLPQTKYPVLFPLFLAIVWKLNPNFPANLTGAFAVSSVLYCAFLLLSYVFLRRASLSRVASAFAVAMIAFNPAVVLFASTLNSDFLFGALTLAAALLADRYWRNPDSPKLDACIIGVLLGLSILTRTAGVASLAGVAIAAYRRGKLRRITPVGISAVAMVLVSGLLVHFTRPAYLPPSAGSPPVGFQHVLTYYSSYSQYWLLSVPNIATFVQLLWYNLRQFAIGPGNFFILTGFAVAQTLFMLTLALLVSALSIGGICRLARHGREGTLSWMLLCQVPLLVTWNYPIYFRFLIPFLPLFILGALVEGKRLAHLIANAFRTGSISDRFVAAALAVSVAGLALFTGFCYSLALNPIRNWAEERAVLAHERREAYDWLIRNTPTSARVLAYEDGVLSLNTGRQAIRPVSITTDCYYLPQQRCASDFLEMGTWTSYVQAKYWYVDNSDFRNEGSRQGDPKVKAYIAGLKHRMKRVFVSSGGTAEIYDTTCLTQHDDPSCPKADVGSLAKMAQSHR